MKNLISLLLLVLLATSAVSAQTRSRASATRSKHNKHTKHTGVQYGTASYYANKFQGRPTASGELYDKNKMTCADNALPLGTWVKVTNVKNKRYVIVRVTDRLHHNNKRLIDLSGIAAAKLGYLKRGLARVKVEVLSKKSVAGIK